jgi:hypothetical protein
MEILWKYPIQKPGLILTIIRIIVSKKMIKIISIIDKKMKATRNLQGNLKIDINIRKYQARRVKNRFSSRITSENLEIWVLTSKYKAFKAIADLLFRFSKTTLIICCKPYIISSLVGWQIYLKTLYIIYIGEP